MNSAPAIGTATTPSRTPAARPTASPPHTLALMASSTATSFPCGKPSAPSRPSVRWASDPGETLSRAADDVGKRRFSRDERGATATEYAVLIVFVAMAVAIAPIVSETISAYYLSSQIVARSWLTSWLGLIFQPLT